MLEKPLFCWIFGASNTHPYEHVRALLRSVVHRVEYFLKGVLHMDLSSVVTLPVALPGVPRGSEFHYEGCGCGDGKHPFCGNKVRLSCRGHGTPSEYL
jgi:hypothetical protein